MVLVRFGASNRQQRNLSSDQAEAQEHASNLPIHIFIALSNEDVSSENDEAANSKRGVDADQYPGVPSLEDRGDKKAQADQCCRHDQRSSTYAEGGASLIQQARRPDQR